MKQLQKLGHDLEKIADELYKNEKTGEIINRRYDAKMSNGEDLFDKDTFYAEMKNGSNKINAESFAKKKERRILNILME